MLGLSGSEPKSRRALGIADLTLGAAIIAGRASHGRWRTVAVRSLLHLVFAREYARGGRRPGAVAMCALFVIDGSIAIALRAAAGERQR
ncbi:MAG: hypothetical protein ACTH31_15725 [Pseudoclavibacter sp.]